MLENRAVFLSYASQDAEAARRLCEALRAAGVEVWFDQNELRGGDAWDAKIRRQIKECALFLPLISANTEQRTEGYFRLEWKLAVDRSHLMADDAPFIVPIVIDGIAETTARVPEKFLERQWLRVGTEPQSAVARIVALLGRTPPTAPAPAPAPRPPPPPRRKRRRLAWPGVAVLVVLGTASVPLARWYQRSGDVRWAREAGLPQLAQLADQQEFAAAFALARRLEALIPGDTALQAAWPRIAANPEVVTEPAGVEVFVKPYEQPGAAWQPLGPTPLQQVLLPHGFYRWEFRHAGYVTAERAAMASTRIHVTLGRPGQAPAGMVPVTGGGRLNLAGLRHLPDVELPAFFIDKYEVTNRQYQAFIEAGGYAQARWWTHPFVEGGRELTRTEALARFVDRTGRPGPSTWTNGTYPVGEDDLPVAGVSWFEAMAFAAFAGKRLPSVRHWNSAASPGFVQHIVPLSNFSSNGPAAVGKHAGMSACGAYDMAGNVKEWCTNAAEAQTYYILGGGWRDPDYQFTAADAQSPFDRGPANGFRCMLPASGTTLPAPTDEPLARATRDYASETPVNDEVFAALRTIYAYDEIPLAARIEQEDDSDSRWRKTRVSVDAVYGGERLPIYLFRPRNFPPPYQTIIYFPGSGSIARRSSADLERADLLAFLVGSGRAVAYPIYKSTYERGDEITTSLPNASKAYRDHVVQWSNDFSRSVDYLVTRPDVQADKLAFLGNSWGARFSSILLAVEPRIRVSVLMSGGFPPSIGASPQIDELNFAPRVKVPTLMVNGRLDFTFPLATSQIPMFRMLGAAEGQKQHRLFDYAHALPSHVVAKEAIDWLDRHLGEVK